MRISDWSSDVCSSDLCSKVVKEGSAMARRVASTESVATSSNREKPASLRFMFGSLPQGFQDAHVPSPAKSGLGDGMGRKNTWETSLVGRGDDPQSRGGEQARGVKGGAERPRAVGQT